MTPATSSSETHGGKLPAHVPPFATRACSLPASAACRSIPTPTRHPQPQKALPITQQYWFKYNVWVLIISYVGNYFWTHYFYNLLHATYSMPSWFLNKVPIAMFLMTHGYFCFYFVFSTVCVPSYDYELCIRPATRRLPAKRLSQTALRVFWRSSMYRQAGSFLRLTQSAVVVLALAVFTAFMEAWTISAVCAAGCSSWAQAAVLWCAPPLPGWPIPTVPILRD